MPKLFVRNLVWVGFLAAFLGASEARAFGDEPYWPGFGNQFEPEISSGCWKWNWQQHSWYDHCPFYVRPKAYMYPHSYSRVTLRTKG
jgi:hypothetical protein